MNILPGPTGCSGKDHTAVKARLNVATFPIAASWVAAASPVVFLIIGSVATIAAPGFSSIQSPISALAEPARPHSWIINVGFITYGLMVQGLSWGLYVSTERLFTKMMLPTLIFLYGTGGVAAGIFVTGGTDMILFEISEGDLHGVAAWITLSAIMTLMAVGAFVQPLGGKSPVIRKMSLALLALTTTAVLAFVMAPSEPVIKGLLQRAFFITTMTWVFVSSMHVAKQPRRS